MRADGVCGLVAAVVCCLTVFAASSAAQTTETIPLKADPDALATPEAPLVIVTQERVDELERWATEFAAWQVWAEQWLNRRQPGFWSNYIERTKKPDPPAWLDDQFCGLLSGEQPFTRGCALLTTWREDPIVTKQRRTSGAALAQIENPKNSIWWQHIHVDGVYSSTQSNVSAFGLFGAHVSLDVAGRLQTFLAPGILLVSVPTLNGSREMYPATDFGISYRLFDVGRSTVHFNMVQAWVLGNQPNLLNGKLLLAGFSVSFRRGDNSRHQN